MGAGEDASTKVLVHGFLNSGCVAATKTGACVSSRDDTKEKANSGVGERDGTVEYRLLSW